MPRKDPTTTVKVTRSLHRRMHAVLEHVSRNGWASIGVDRGEPPSLSAILDEAIAVFEQRVKGKKS